jgi:predicted Zn-dependent protease
VNFSFWALFLTAVALNAQAPEKLAALGSAIDEQVRNHTSLLSDSTVVEYVESIGRELSTRTPEAGIEWQWKVTRDQLGGSTHEPLSIPGGHIYVSVSLILAAANESELAAMMAHSMAHVVQPSWQHSGHEQAASASVPLVFMGGHMGMGPAEGDRSFLPLGFMKEQRRRELDADRRALAILTAAGYEATALRRYIDRTQKDLSPELSANAALSLRAERIAALETTEAGLQSNTPRQGEEFKAIQEHLRRFGMPAGNARPVPSLYPKIGQ